MGGNFYYAANNDWAEASITWNTAPVANSDILASLGHVNKDGWQEFLFVRASGILGEKLIFSYPK